MSIFKFLAITALVTAAGMAQAQDNAFAIGKSTFGARCALCHGVGGKGDGDIGGLFYVPPADLTKLSERAGGAFPFASVYNILATGLGEKAHGGSEMPIWGDFFLEDALQDRGIGMSDAVYIVQGRILSLTYYLESIQE